jgi:hypothetical protein
MSAITRREVLKAGVALGGLALLPTSSAHAEGDSLSPDTRRALEESPLVYISPLHPDGKESSCHGEVWYCVDEGGVLIGTNKDRWKSRALRSGRDEARIWVGDFGPVKQFPSGFRSGPSFKAKAERVKDDAAFARLLAAYGKKYPDGWGKWRPRFQQGWADGSRVLIRYTPIPSEVEAPIPIPLS